MSRRAKTSFKVRTRGTFLGIKINTSSKLFANEMAKACYSSRQEFLKDVMPVAEARFKELVPKLRVQLSTGVANISGEPLVNVQGSKRVEGLGSYESKSHGSHRPHKDIPDPLTRLVGERGMSVHIKRVSDRLELNTNFKNTRNGLLNFHGSMPKVPRASTLARRLDETCLPFIRDGNFEALLEIFGANASYSILWAISKIYTDRAKALKGAR
jgi:hypothetical protein